MRALVLVLLVAGVVVDAQATQRRSLLSQLGSRASSFARSSLSRVRQGVQNTRARLSNLRTRFSNEFGDPVSRRKSFFLFCSVFSFSFFYRAKLRSGQLLRCLFQDILLILAALAKPSSMVAQAGMEILPQCTMRGTGAFTETAALALCCQTPTSVRPTCCPWTLATALRQATKKAQEIGAAMRAIERARGGGEDGRQTEMNIVTHSAGDADFDTAASRGYIDASRIKIRNRIAVGPVFDGTYVGSVGARVLGRFGRFGAKMGRQAAAELAENSQTVEALQNAQSDLNSGLYKGTRRVDIMTNGLVGLTPRLDRRSVGAGDGFVQSGQRRPYVSETRIVDAVDPFATNHLLQPGYKGVLQNVNDVLSN